MYVFIQVIILFASTTFATTTNSTNTLFLIFHNTFEGDTKHIYMV